MLTFNSTSAIFSKEVSIMSEFGNMLKKLRKERRITQRDLAQMIGVDFTYISKIETGAFDNPPSEALIVKIAEALDTDAEELILIAKKVPNTLRETIIDDDLAVTFLRKMPYLTDFQRKAVKEIINGNETHEH